MDDGLNVGKTMWSRGLILRRIEGGGATDVVKATSKDHGSSWNGNYAATRTEEGNEGDNGRLQRQIWTETKGREERKCWLCSPKIYSNINLL